MGEAHAIAKARLAWRVSRPFFNVSSTMDAAEELGPLCSGSRVRGVRGVNGSLGRAEAPVRRRASAAAEPVVFSLQEIWRRTGKSLMLRGIGSVLVREMALPWSNIISSFSNPFSVSSICADLNRVPISLHDFN
jgi:hypothetical protein